MDLLQIINHHSDCLFNTIVCNCKNVADSGIASTELFVLYTDPEELAMELRDGPCLRRPKNGADRPLHFPCSPLPLAVLRRFGRTTAGYVDRSMGPGLVAGAAPTKPPPPVIYCEVGVSHLHVTESTVWQSDWHRFEIAYLEVNVVLFKVLWNVF